MSLQQLQARKAANAINCSINCSQHHKGSRNFHALQDSDKRHRNGRNQEITDKAD